jgi:hypothetical protein
MGASTFVNFSKITSKDEAFRHLVEEAQYEYGHGGYTGTIAEKGDSVDVGTVATKKEAYDLANKLLDEDDDRISDKWGPAGCITITEGGYVFFGWASD